MSKQALDISQMQHLKGLGIDTSSGSAYWYRIVQHKCDGNIRVISDWKLTFSLDIAYCVGHTLESIRTFILQDILDLLPVIIVHDYEKLELRIKRFVYESGKIMYAVLYEKQDYIDWFIMQSDSELIDAAYEMLCWCIENGYVKTNKEE